MFADFPFSDRQKEFIEELRVSALRSKARIKSEEAGKIMAASVEKTLGKKRYALLETEFKQGDLDDGSIKKHALKALMKITNGYIDPASSLVSMPIFILQELPLDEIHNAVAATNSYGVYIPPETHYFLRIDMEILETVAGYGYKKALAEWGRQREQNEPAIEIPPQFER